MPTSFMSPSTARSSVRPRAGRRREPRPGRLETMRDMLLAMDPPATRRTASRSPEFKARGHRRTRRPGSRGRSRDLRPRDQSGPDVEFVHDVCAHLPSQILGEIMGLPAEDWPAIHAMAERNSGSQDPDVSDGQERGSASIEMAMYAMQFAADRGRQVPRGSHRCPARRGVRRPPDDRCRLRSLFRSARHRGNDTTRTMLSSGTLASTTPTNSQRSSRPERILGPWRKSSVGRTRSTTSAARRWSIPNSEGRSSAPATRWR